MKAHPGKIRRNEKNIWSGVEILPKDKKKIFFAKIKKTLDDDCLISYI